MTDRISIFGTKISITNIEKAPGQIMELAGKKSGYICLPDGFVVVTARKNKKLQNILNNSLLTFPDGSPIVMYSRLKKIKGMGSVSGFWLVKKLLQTELTHYFYGSSDEELDKIKNNIETEFPESKVLGYKSPPWVMLEEIENHPGLKKDIEEINRLKPDLVWIGMNSPKQDYLMAAYHKQFDKSILIGIGGVYDYLSGTMKISPEWVKKLSLRWVYRIVQNPKRIFKKAVIAIFGFSWLTFKEILSGQFKKPT
ncbi:MAG: WecB/TagA/CpsF family glycosyltransferase [Bacteroidales bacterium]|nr:WecB/TagA/CpsF family glycosyltransferase [Bacteroidales bacterium]